MISPLRLLWKLKYFCANENLAMGHVLWEVGSVPSDSRLYGAEITQPVHRRAGLVSSMLISFGSFNKRLENNLGITQV